MLSNHSPQPTPFPPIIFFLPRSPPAQPSPPSPPPPCAAPPRSQTWSTPLPCWPRGGHATASCKGWRTGCGRGARQASGPGKRERWGRGEGGRGGGGGEGGRGISTKLDLLRNLKGWGTRRRNGFLRSGETCRWITIHAGNLMMPLLPAPLLLPRHSNYNILHDRRS